jgi:hypothetical protein
MAFLKFFYALCGLIFLMGITGCRTTGDDPNVYWDNHGSNGSTLVTPFGGLKTTQ